MTMRREISIRPEDVEPDSGTRGVTRVLMGRNGEGQWVHLLTVPAGYTSEAHFHEADQFQVVVAGSMDMAGEVLTPGSVHYTDARTPYGPFTAGPDGLTLMVIRPGADRKGTRTPVRTVIDWVKEAQRSQAPSDTPAASDTPPSAATGTTTDAGTDATAHATTDDGGAGAPSGKARP
jgi:hypothetical protein